VTTVLAVVAVLVVLATFVGIWAYLNQPATSSDPVADRSTERPPGHHEMRRA
jgi:hypothetical protein